MITSLITGGAGFVGSHLADRLIAAGHEVVLLDNLSTGSVVNIETAVSSGRAWFVYGDCARGTRALKASLRNAGSARFDFVFHLASPASPQAYGSAPWETLLANSRGTMSLIDLALDHGATFLYASTSEIYGDPLVHPQPESYFGNVDPIGPRSCYDEGKRFGEAAVAAAVAARGLKGRIVRFFNCYGPRMQLGDGRLVPTLIDAAIAGRALPIHGSGKQMRSLTFVDDALDLVQLICEASFVRLTPVNVGNDDERSIEDIARLVAQIARVDFRPEYQTARPSDPERRRPDLTLARELGWAPATGLEAGLAKTFAAYASGRLAAV